MQRHTSMAYPYNTGTLILFLTYRFDSSSTNRVKSQFSFLYDLLYRGTTLKQTQKSGVPNDTVLPRAIQNVSPACSVAVSPVSSLRIKVPNKQCQTVSLVHCRHVSECMLATFDNDTCLVILVSGGRHELLCGLHNEHHGRHGVCGLGLGIGTKYIAL